MRPCRRILPLSIDAFTPPASMAASHGELSHPAIGSSDHHQTFRLAAIPHLLAKNTPVRIKANQAVPGLHQRGTQGSITRLNKAGIRLTLAARCIAR